MDYKGVVAVFENGYCECLEEAISNRKTNRVSVINDGEIIEFSKLCFFRKKALCIIVSVDNNVNCILFILHIHLLITMII